MAENKNSNRALIGEILGEIVANARSGRGGSVAKIGLMAVGSEHVHDGDEGQKMLVEAAMSVMASDSSLDVVMIGPKKIKDIPEHLSWIETGGAAADVAEGLNQAITSGKIEGAVAMHFPFPLGVTTIGRVITPLRGGEMIIASSTGTSSTDRIESMVRNALYGVAVAKSLGIADPKVGILNVDGAPSVNRILNRLKEAGYKITFGESVRSDGGSVLRGNDILAGAVDVCVTDTLTGNVLMKLFSSWNNGGVYETLGYGYGPSVGEGWSKTISIVSRASGAPVIANALKYTAAAVRGHVHDKVKAELAGAKKAGLDDQLAALQKAAAPAEAEVKAPPAEPTDEEIHGVDVMEIDNAVHAVWAAGIYAEGAMGCTGPVVKVPSKHYEKAKEVLAAAGYL